MLNQLIWWGSVGVEMLLLIRGVRGKLLTRYPVFYSYVLFVLMQSLLRFFVRQSHPELYRYVYWPTEFLAVIFGCAVIFEIYHGGLASYPGTARMARNLLAFVFALALAKALVNAAYDPRWWVEATARDTEGILRTVQALSITALVALFLFYSIPFGRNLRGILVGYGLFISASVLSLTLTTAGVNNTRDFWAYLYPASYFIALGVWAGHLWSYCPDPHPKTAVHLELEYQKVASGTHRRLQEARGYLAKAVRS